MPRNSFFQRVYHLVRQVPPGRVVTYGQVARALGEPHTARTVGWAMRFCPDDIPWWRVVGAQGRILTASRPQGTNHQQVLLAREGVMLDDDHICLSEYAVSDEEMRHLAERDLEHL